MKKIRYNRHGIGITLSTTLWTWAVALVTLLVFAAAMVPHQKKSFQENLESKAHGVAVSLRDVAAGAVVNEDFSSVVDHCKEMLTADTALEYLVITKNDGFSLIHERSGWRSEQSVGSEWRPLRREARSGIGNVPLFQRRVFYYSIPFDYSGIEWGWIHVGLSLRSYDRSVTSVYKRTAVLAVVCMVLSLGASSFYARRLVRPILNLRNVVQRVAGGDLNARADNNRRDELGTLSRSVNSMTEALLRRDRILESVRFAAQEFLRTSDWNLSIKSVLAKIGAAAAVSRGYVLENERDGSGALVAFQRHFWTLAALNDPESSSFQKLSYHEQGLSRWVQMMENGKVLTGLEADLPAAERALVHACGARSIILIPIHVEAKWWGVLGFDDCDEDRLWSDGERDSLRAAADILGAAIAKQRTQDALIEAKETLERRVQERTRELQEQMHAKDRAHAQLADAQQQLMQSSRQAGMAEVATGVLHNVGNVLNSVNVSVNVISDRLKRSQIGTLTRVASLLSDNQSNMTGFLSSDPRGRRLPELVIQLGKALEEERSRFADEVSALQKNVEHIKEIVAMQQSYATVAGVTEDLPITTLIEDALRMNQGALARSGIRIQREFGNVPAARVDKHKVLQILVNLIRNAKHALEVAHVEEKVLTLGVCCDEPGRIKVLAHDNGIGIAPENLTRIFGHGFTTKKNGHGFGLHSGALAANEMGGALRAFSDGLGTGATFVLELPSAVSASEVKSGRNDD